MFYFDTNGVVFTSRACNWVQPVGPYLGDLTDDINSRFMGVHAKDRIDVISLSKTLFLTAKP